MDPVLRDKIKQWALGSRGMFRAAVESPTGDAAHQGSTFVLWEDACDDPDIRAAIKWGKLKSIPRSVEKLLRSYREDVSRLLDVCRQSIIFEDCRDLVECVQV
jgi:predicted urease superfamily metal-dependent hydrolase